MEKVMVCPPNMTHVFVFHPKIFVLLNKLLYYEMQESNFGRDIDIHHKFDKIELLNKLGYEMSTHAEIKLSSYLSLLYMNSTIKFKVSNSEDPIQFTHYLDYLRLL